jgi:hypothetical protein
MIFQPRSRLWRGALCALLVTVTGSCSDSGELAPTTPSGPTAALGDLAGNWGGYVSTGSGNTGVCYGFRWTATQDGSAASGPSVIGTLGRGESFNNTMSGTMTATPSSGGFAVSMVFPDRLYEGGITCSMRGSGTVKSGLSMMSGTMTLEWTPGCNGRFFGAVPTNSHRGAMDLTKGGDARSCP